MENMADKIRCRIENFRRTKRCLNVKNRVQFREISAIKLGAELKTIDAELKENWVQFHQIFARIKKMQFWKKMVQNCKISKRPG